ncbi:MULTISPECIES: hypothetical protein [Halococcus]|uniref:Uncharacterized protein n=1 Tax=Halococcus salifodinae DSM 8989 TaxID=1227456 RepID=M0N3Z4_9EURY|nr:MULTISPECIES: hypothetical protein [Halococcus]EMA52576.1 hypothetical protein C450_10773 [Halococcus salifodinae DSM 8989]
MDERVETRVYGSVVRPTDWLEGETRSNEPIDDRDVDGMGLTSVTMANVSWGGLLSSERSGFRVVRCRLPQSQRL